MKGQTAVVVGGARGIGLAIGREFANEGCSVGLIDRDPHVVETAASLSKDAGVATVGIPCDATSYTALQTTVQALEGTFSRIDHLVFAVAIGSGKFGFPFWNLSPSDWPRLLEINIMTAVNTLHAFAPHFVRRRRGSMLLIASVAGQIGSQTDPPYSASKAALINFMQCAAKDFAPYNVRVNALCPGMVKTELNKSVWAAWNQDQPDSEKKSYEAWTAEKIQKVVPLNRWQTPEDMAAMTVFLASSRGENITGQTLNVDGGFVMHW